MAGDQAPGKRELEQTHTITEVVQKLGFLSRDLERLSYIMNSPSRAGNPRPEVLSEMWQSMEKLFVALKELEKITGSNTHRGDNLEEYI